MVADPFNPRVTNSAVCIPMDTRLPYSEFVMFVVALKTSEASCLAIILPLYGFSTVTPCFGADVLFLLLNPMENVGSLIPCLLSTLQVPVCSQAH